MKHYKVLRRGASLCLSILLTGMTTFLFALPAAAASSPSIDLSKSASLNLKEISVTTSQPISGLTVTLYRVASFVSATGSRYEVTSDYSSCSADLNNLTTADQEIAAASKVYSYIQANSKTGITQTSDSSGNAEFSNLSLGLYLVRITSADISVTVNSGLFFVSLPTLSSDGSSWLYDVTAQPKSTFSTSSGSSVTVTHTVRKVWADSGNEASRPTSVSAGLYRNGTLYDTVTLNTLNNWSYSWTGLSAADTWTCKETSVPTGYVATVADSDTLTTITNTYDTSVPTTTISGTSVATTTISSSASSATASSSKAATDTTRITTGGTPLSSNPQTGQNVAMILLCVGAEIILIAIISSKFILERRKERKEEKKTAAAF
jgi:hypothetical protein